MIIESDSRFPYFEHRSYSSFTKQLGAQDWWDWWKKDARLSHFFKLASFATASTGITLKAKDGNSELDYAVPQRCCTPPNIILQKVPPWP
jgi:hypothetical protein